MKTMVSHVITKYINRESTNKYKHSGINRFKKNTKCYARENKRHHI